MGDDLCLIVLYFAFLVCCTFILYLLVVFVVHISLLCCFVLFCFGVVCCLVYLGLCCFFVCCGWLVWFVGLAVVCCLLRYCCCFCLFADCCFSLCCFWDSYCLLTDYVRVFCIGLLNLVWEFRFAVDVKFVCFGWLILWLRLRFWLFRWLLDYIFSCMLLGCFPVTLVLRCVVIYFVCVFVNCLCFWFGLFGWIVLLRVALFGWLLLLIGLLISWYLCFGFGWLLLVCCYFELISVFVLFWLVVGVYFVYVCLLTVLLVFMLLFVCG